MINPVSLTVTDISDSMPMVMEDIPQLDIDDLTLPCCDTSSSNSVPPMYCISSEHSGDCFECPLSSGGADCQGHEFSICLADYLEEPDMILEPMDDDAEPVMILEPVDDDEDILEPMDDDEDPDHPAYCSQNHGDCSTCSLVNYGRDCMNNPVSDREVSNG